MILKNLVLVIILFCSIDSVLAQKKQITADQFLNTNLKRSAIENKPILLLCYGNANPWSQIIDTMMDSKPCADILNKYYIVKKIKTKETGWAAKKTNLNGADQLFDRFFSKEEGSAASVQLVPTIFIINRSGKKLGQYSGFPENAGGFITTLAKTSAITTQEQGIITTVLNNAYTLNGPPTAEEVLNNAVKQAKATHKKVFLIFHASWCHWCHVLDTAMNEPVCKPFFEKNFVIAHIVTHESAPYLLKQNLGSDAMMSKYQGISVNGIPFWVIFDEDGKLLVDNTGFPSPTSIDDYAKFEKILKETVSASAEDLAAVKKAFSDLSVRNGLKN